MQHSPHNHIQIAYGVTKQPTPSHTLPSLSSHGIKQVQDIVGTLLQYACAVDPVLAPVLITIAASKTKGTQAVQQVCNKLLDYVATHPHASLRFIANKMILAVHNISLNPTPVVLQATFPSHAAMLLTLLMDKSTLCWNAFPDLLKGNQGSPEHEPQSPLAATTSNQEPLGKTLRANLFPKVTDLFCWLPLHTLFYQLEAANLGDLLWLSVWPGVWISHTTGV